MGIRTFTFNGESSDTYGVLITQNASYNAPERAGEMLSIPGRNGAFWQDYGRFENIEVTYKCAIGEGTKADFVDAMSDIRSWLCSPVGYCRLEDDYNPNEYRMAVYKSGLETDEPFLTGAEFDIVFECKPQRFLKSGETAVSVTSGDTVTNPTRFDAKPQLQVWGYGEISLGGQTITVVDNAPIGNVQVSNTEAKDRLYSHTFSFEIDDTFANVGDDITVDSVRYGFVMKCEGGNCNGVTASVSGDLSTVTASPYIVSYAQFSIRFLDKHLAYSTPQTLTGRCSYTIEHSQRGDIASWVDASLSYDGATGFTFTATYDTTAQYITEGYTNTYPSVLVEPIWLDSTKYALGNPLYIDLDIGEAYKEEDGVWVSCNNAVQIPSELPTLQSGANTITYDNTFTQFKVVPRWWQV